MTAAHRVPARKQRGVLMVALMAGIAIMLILSTVAVQSWTDVARRDKEAEMMFRAQDIVRALKRFQADKGKLPTEFKELIEPGSKGQFFLRQLWKDPLVKGGKWQFVYASPAGGLFDPTVPAAPPGGEGTLPGSSPSLLNPAQPPGGSATGTGTDFLNPGDGSGDPTGLPIAGVKTRCKDKPFRKYKDKTEYSDWVFSIFDLQPGGAVPTPQPQQNQQGQLNPPSSAPGDFTKP